MGKFIDAVERINIENYKANNYVSDYNAAQSGGTASSTPVSINMIFHGDNIYAEKAHDQYLNWLDANPGESYEDFLEEEVYYGGDFSIQTVSDEQKETLVGVTVLIGGAILCVYNPKAGVKVMGMAISMLTVEGMNPVDSDKFQDAATPGVEYLIDQIKMLFNKFL